MSFKRFRIVLLLLILALVAGATLWEGWLVRSWKQPLQIVIYPINGDGAAETEAYLNSLQASQFEEIGSFLLAQGQRYRLDQLPTPRLQLAPMLLTPPPQTEQGPRSALSAIMWSLRLRYYAFRHTPFWQSLGQIRLFVVFHTADAGKPLQHSLGLQKGLLGVVHVFANREQAAQNNIVIAHELLHTLGATDKYDAQGQPRFPEGFPDPDGGERYPQHQAEIMAGRIAVRPDQAVIPEMLGDCAIGPKTAWEINW